MGGRARGAYVGGLFRGLHAADLYIICAEAHVCQTYLLLPDRTEEQGIESGPAYS